MVRLEKDLCKIAGSTIETPAFQIIAEQECSKRFGSEKKTRKFKGVIIRAYPQKKAGAKRSTTYIEADYDLETSTKTKRIKSLILKW